MPAKYFKPVAYRLVFIPPSFLSLMLVSACTSFSNPGAKPENASTPVFYTIDAESTLEAAKDEMELGIDLKSKGYSSKGTKDSAKIAGRLTANAQSGKDKALNQPYQALQNPEIKTWYVMADPIPGLRIHSGSVLISGLGTRIMNPVPASPLPFHLPPKISAGTFLSPGDTMNTRRFGVECRAENVQTVFLAEDGLEKTVLALASGTLGTRRDVMIQATAAAAASHIAADTEESWYPEHSPLPERRVSIAGGEAIVQYRLFRFTGFSLLSIDGLGSRAACGSFEAGFDHPYGSLAAGALSMEREYAALDGKRPKTIQRVFIAPSISFQTLLPFFDVFRVGPLYSISKTRRDHTWEYDTLSEDLRIALQLRKDKHSLAVEAAELSGLRIFTAELHLSLEEKHALTAETAFRIEERETSPETKIYAGFALHAAPVSRITLGLHSEIESDGALSPNAALPSRLTASFSCVLPENYSFTGEFSHKTWTATNGLSLKLALRLSIDGM